MVIGATNAHACAVVDIVAVVFKLCLMWYLSPFAYLYDLLQFGLGKRKGLDVRRDMGGVVGENWLVSERWRCLAWVGQWDWNRKAVGKGREETGVVGKGRES